MYESLVDRSATANERDGWTLGTLVKKVYSESDPAIADMFKHALVKPRNDAVHRSESLDRSVAVQAFGLVRDLIGSRLDEPLPPGSNQGTN